MAVQIQQQLPVLDSFHLFPKLVNEIRLIIWEYTWPEPRLIEAATFDNPNIPEGDEETGEPYEVVNLRIAGTVSTMLKKDLIRIVEDDPVENCPDPIALQVCHQSRTHTLRRYQVMKSLAGNFYYSPRRDVLFFSVDVADDCAEYLPMLRRYHQAELNTFEQALVLESEWPELPREGTGIMDCLSSLGGLKIIQLLWESDDSGSGQTVGLVDEGEKVSLRALAGRHRARFPKIIKHERCTAREIEVIDADGISY